MCVEGGSRGLEFSIELLYGYRDNYFHERERVFVIDGDDDDDLLKTPFEALALT